MNQENLKSIELLVLDVQGAERNIISTLGELKYKPKFIIYEDDSSSSKEDLELLKNDLFQNGYIFFFGENDKVWIRP